MVKYMNQKEKIKGCDKVAKCENCKKAIQYNQYKRYRGKLLCYACYDTRLIRKKQKKLAEEGKAEELMKANPVEDKPVELKYELTDDEPKEAEEQTWDVQSAVAIRLLVNAAVFALQLLKDHVFLGGHKE